METDLIFRRVGCYSMKQTSIDSNGFFDNCCICKDVKSGDVLVRITPFGEEEKYICVGCLLHYYKTELEG